VALHIPYLTFAGNPQMPGIGKTQTVQM
jgi:hypothetical protein